MNYYRHQLSYQIRKRDGLAKAKKYREKRKERFLSYLYGVMRQYEDAFFDLYKTKTGVLLRYNNGWFTFRGMGVKRRLAWVLEHTALMRAESQEQNLYGEGEKDEP